AARHGRSAVASRGSARAVSSADDNRPTAPLPRPLTHAWEERKIVRAVVVERAEVTVRNWSGWTGFAALLLVLVGMIDFFEGLIAVIRDTYFVIAGNQLIVFDRTTWGWITMILGAIIFLVGLGLASGAGWARWTAIVLLAINLIEQLAWLRNTGYPLWTLSVVALEILALYALTVRWRDNEDVRST